MAPDVAGADVHGIRQRSRPHVSGELPCEFMEIISFSTFPGVVFFLLGCLSAKEIRLCVRVCVALKHFEQARMELEQFAPLATSRHFERDSGSFVYNRGCISRGKVFRTM